MSPLDGSSTDVPDMTSEGQWTRIAADANFFILAFGHQPEVLTRFKQIIDRLSIRICISPQILDELHGSLHRYVKDVVEIIGVSDEELQEYISKAKGILDRIPQAPDLSLLIVLGKLNQKWLVSSDFQLLQSLRSLEPKIEGLMGSAFLLDLLERSLKDEEDSTFLENLRERVLNTEIKYSLARSSAYDPMTRIKLIENQAFHILRTLRSPILDKEELIGMSATEALGLLTFLQELRRRYTVFVQKIHEQNYKSVLEEIDSAYTELYNHLVLLAWELSATAHRKLIRQITPDMVLLNYLAALCHLYLGEQENLVQAKNAIEECNRILLTTRPDATTYRRLMIMTHLLRITINILLEDFDTATMYFSIFSRKCQEWEFTKEEATSQALYLTLLVIRGDITSTEFPLITDPEEVIRFLVDLASLYFTLRRFWEAWRLLNQVIYIIQYFDLFSALEPALKRMTLIYYAEGQEKKSEFLEIIERVEKWLKEKRHDKTLVKTLKSELSRKRDPSPDYFTETSLLAEKLHPDLSDWMMVIDRVDTVLLEGSILICRNLKRNWNFGLLIKGVLLEEKAKSGEQVRLGEGKFKVTHPPRSLKQRYRILALINAEPSGKSRIYIRGGHGFRLIQLGPQLNDSH